MKTFPLYLQHDLMDCGPACLKMVAAYFGKVLSLDGLRERSNQSREGVSLLGISEAAGQIGLRATGVMIGLDELKEAPLPCIVHWNQQHFVVVYDLKVRRGEEQVYVADPAAGKLRYSGAEFSRCWCSTRDQGKEVGVALLLEPSSEFYQLGADAARRPGWRFLLNYIRPYRPLVVQLILGLIFGCLVQLVLPFLTQSIVDYGVAGRHVGYIYLVLLAQLMFILSGAALGFIRGWILLHIGARVNIALVSDFLMKLMRLPMRYYDTRLMGDLIQRINDHSRIQHYLTESGLSVVFSILNIGVLVAVLLIYNPLVFALFVVGTCVYVWWVWSFLKKRAYLDRKNFAQQAANQSTLIQLISGMQEIRLSGCEQQKRWAWERIQARIFRLRMKGLSLSQYQESGALLINQVKNLVITALVAQMVVEGRMTLGMMLAVQFIIGQLNGPVDQLLYFARDTQDAWLSLERVGEVHAREDEEVHCKPTRFEIPQQTDIFIDGLSFGYDSTQVGRPVLQQISLHIPTGKQTAIVGTSGSGKTTLIKLLLGFYPPQEGEVRVGECALTDYNMRAWRSSCGVVMQDGFIFSDTIARNIAPGVDTIDKERLLQAVCTANIQEFVESLPLGYNTMIGNDGNGLSQGQKQRILIARAVYKNPAYVFLDEATNALDTNNERQIMNNLNYFLAGRTSVVIAHRLSTVRHADQIVVLDQGIVVEVGTHDQLLQQEGAYYRLVKNQLDI